MVNSNRNDFRVWQLVFGFDDFVDLSYIAYKLNMMPRSVRRILERVDSPLVEFDDDGSLAVRVVGSPRERAALFEEIGAGCCKVSPECRTAIRESLTNPATLNELVEVTGFSRYEIISAIQVMMDVNCTEHMSGRRVYRLKEIECTRT